MTKNPEKNQEHTAVEPEKNELTDGQKLIASLSGVALTAVLALGAGIALDRGNQKNEPKPENTPTPVEQSIIETNINNPNNQPSDAITPSINENSHIGTSDETEQQESPSEEKPKSSKIQDMTKAPDTPTEDCPDPKDASCTVIYVDPGSGETVISTPNLTPEKAGGPDVVALGFLKLLDIGVSSDQFSAIKSDFLDYSLSQKTPIREISITTASIRDTANPSTAERTLEFTVTIDRESTLNAKVYYVGIGEPTLTLYDPETDTKVYESK